MAWDELFDPSNPFNRSGLSAEVQAALDYLVEARRRTGVDVVVTSTTDHPIYAASGARSRHRLPGTWGEGLALDCRLRTRGNLIHRAVFDIWRPAENKLWELIYADAPWNLRGGVRVGPYAVSDHRDHVHVSWLRGTFVQYPAPPSPAPVPPQEGDVPIVVEHPHAGSIVVAPDGGVFSLDGAPYFGSLPELGHVPVSPIVGAAWTPSGLGYWMVGRDGALYAFGDAPEIVGANVDPLKTHLNGRPVVGLDCVDARSVALIAFDRSNDGSPFDTYVATA